MRPVPASFRALALGFVTIFALISAASAAEVRVMISGGLTAAYTALVRDTLVKSGLDPIPANTTN
jgi:molybdate transport system substrate-binding protein